MSILPDKQDKFPPTVIISTVEVAVRGIYSELPQSLEIMSYKYYY